MASARAPPLGQVLVLAMRLVRVPALVWVLVQVMASPEQEPVALVQQ